VRTDIIIATNKSQFEIQGMVGEIIDNTENGTFNVIATCQDASAAVNRNYGLAMAESPIVVMLDDDISGFKPGWLPALLKPFEDEEVVLVSARLVDEFGKRAPMMGGLCPMDNEWHPVNNSGYRDFTRVTTAAIAFRNPHGQVLFDEEFIGSGYEDTDWMNRMNIAHQFERFLVNNRCRLIHANHEQNQGGEYFIHNKAYYLSKWPDDNQVKGQQDWTK
jgi:glycosyltransferase involved in cell wall biosynthesis